MSINVESKNHQLIFLLRKIVSQEFYSEAIKKKNDLIKKNMKI